VLPQLCGPNAQAGDVSETSSVGSVTGIHDDAGLTSQVVEAEEGYVERSARAFAESDLVFSRGFSNAPFLPVAFFGSTHYGDANGQRGGRDPRDGGQRYQVSSTSQYGGVPFLLNKRSMVVIGEYLSYSISRGQWRGLFGGLSHAGRGLSLPGVGCVATAGCGCALL
jgi:hypothetical protein